MSEEKLAGGNRNEEELFNAYDAMTERLLEGKYFVIDLFPRRVPAARGARYFAFEEFALENGYSEELYQKFARILLKLNCYFDMAVTEGSGWEENPSPERLYGKITGLGRTGFINILLPVEESLITLNGGDLYMTVFHYSSKLLGTVADLADAEGLFVRE